MPRVGRRYPHNTAVIPGRATWRGPGIHDPSSWLWIPGSLATRQIDFVNLRQARDPE